MKIFFVVLILILLFFLITNTFGFFTGAPYAPTPSKKIKELIKILKLNKNDVVVDLGSGDGRLLIDVYYTKSKAIGYELNPFLYLLSKYRTRKLKGVEVCFSDFWRADLKSATVIFVFILPQFMKRLEKKISTEVKPGTRVVTYLVSLPNHKPIQQILGFNIYKF